jgi:prolyl 4-hydroxylase
MTEKILSINPPVSFYNKLFTDAECDYVIDNSENPYRFYKSGVYSAPGESIVDLNIRTSSSFFDEENLFHHIRNKAYETIKHKFEHIENFSIDHFEKCEVQKYNPTEYVRPHNDYFEKKLGVSGRIATLLIYLNDGFTGGDTRFNKLNIVITPEKGSAIFFSYFPENDVIFKNALTLHESLPVLTGVKYVITQWVREKPILPGNRY